MEYGIYEISKAYSLCKESSESKDRLFDIDRYYLYPFDLSG